jgi:hypothetical protein
VPTRLHLTETVRQITTIAFIQITDNSIIIIDKHAASLPSGPSNLLTDAYEVGRTGEQLPSLRPQRPTLSRQSRRHTQKTSATNHFDAVKVLARISDGRRQLISEAACTLEMFSALLTTTPINRVWD